VRFLFLKPTNPPQDINFSKKLMKQVRHLEKMSLSEFTKEFGQGPKQTRISYAGGYPIAVQDEASTKRDIKVTLLTSFLGVMILFGLSFRTARILFYVGTPLAAGFLWTLGFAGLAFRNLNILTCIFSCVLIGLGVDFAIHIVNRYFDQDKAGADVLQRLQKTYEEAGTGIIIGAITTSAAFYSIAISDFRGFRELALLTGTGVLFCLLAMFFLLPSLLVYFANETDPMRRVTIAGFGLQPLLNLLQRYPRGLLIATFVTVCILAILGARVDFDDNLKNFRPTDHETLHLQDKITGWLGGSTSEIFLVAQEESEEEVMETNTLICDALEKLEASGMIAGTRSISKYFPSPSQQRENMEFIRQNRDVFDMERIKRTFNEALKENGFERIGLYDGYLENLSRAFSAEEIVLPSSLQDTELGRLMKLFVFQKGGHSKAVTYIVPPKDLWSRADTAEFRGMIIRNLEANGVQRESFSLTGASLLTGDLKELIIRNLRSSLWLAGLTIILVLFIYYRSLLPLVFSILPLTTGLAILVGTMVILGCDFNFFNVIVLPMIVGIGIDDGVHFTNTYRRLDHGDMLQPMSRTGRAVVLTSLTTLVGFGSISLSHYPGLKSMGYVAVIGISACLFASVVLLPGIFSILRKPR